MKRSYWIIGGVIIAVVLAVLFVPGVAEFFEAAVLFSLFLLSVMADG